MLWAGQRAWVKHESLAGEFAVQFMQQHESQSFNITRLQQNSTATDTCCMAVTCFTLPVVASKHDIV